MTEKQERPFIGIESDILMEIYNKGGENLQARLQRESDVFF